MATFRPWRREAPGSACRRISVTLGFDLPRSGSPGKPDTSPRLSDQLVPPARNTPLRGEAVPSRFPPIGRLDDLLRRLNPATQRGTVVQENAVPAFFPRQAPVLLKITANPPDQRRPTGLAVARSGRLRSRRCRRSRFPGCPPGRCMPLWKRRSDEDSCEPCRSSGYPECMPRVSRVSFSKQTNSGSTAGSPASINNWTTGSVAKSCGTALLPARRPLPTLAPSSAIRWASSGHCLRACFKAASVASGSASAPAITGGDFTLAVGPRVAAGRPATRPWKRSPPSRTDHGIARASSAAAGIRALAASASTAVRIGARRLPLATPAGCRHSRARQSCAAEQRPGPFVSQVQIGIFRCVRRHYCSPRPPGDRTCPRCFPPAPDLAQRRSKHDHKGRGH